MLHETFARKPFSYITRYVNSYSISHLITDRDHEEMLSKLGKEVNYKAIYCWGQRDASEAEAILSCIRYTDHA